MFPEIKKSWWSGEKKVGWEDRGEIGSYTENDKTFYKICQTCYTVLHLGIEYCDKNCPSERFLFCPKCLKKL